MATAAHQPPPCRPRTAPAGSCRPEVQSRVHSGSCPRRRPTQQARTLSILSSLSATPHGALCAQQPLAAPGCRQVFPSPAFLSFRCVPHSNNRSARHARHSFTPLTHSSYSIRYNPAKHCPAPSHLQSKVPRECQPPQSNQSSTAPPQPSLQPYSPLPRARGCLPAASAILVLTKIAMSYLLASQFSTADTAARASATTARKSATTHVAPEGARGAEQAKGVSVYGHGRAKRVT